jgi:uncharacterized protein (DUF1684 family)
MRSARSDHGTHGGVVTSELEGFRAAKDDFFRTHPQSPLTSGQCAEFTGLAYFPEDPAMRIEGALDTKVDREERSCCR